MGRNSGGGGGSRGGGGGDRELSASQLEALYKATNGDVTKMLEATGYTGKPKLADELNPEDAWEGVIMNRGVQTAQFAEDLKKGKMHYGGGTGVDGGMNQINALGDGIYAWAGGESKGKAKMYGHNIVSMTLSKKARVADYDKLKGELLSKGVKLKDLHRKISAYAISKGYHAIHQNSGNLHKADSGGGGLFGAKSDIVVVLDRRKLTIKK